MFTLRGRGRVRRLEAVEGRERWLCGRCCWRPAAVSAGRVVRVVGSWPRLRWRASAGTTSSRASSDSGGLVDGVVVGVAGFVGLAGLEHGPGAGGELAGDGAVGLDVGVSAFTHQAAVVDDDPGGRGGGRRWASSAANVPARGWWRRVGVHRRCRCRRTISAISQARSSRSQPAEPELVPALAQRPRIRSARRVGSLVAGVGGDDLGDRTPAWHDPATRGGRASGPATAERPCAAGGSPHVGHRPDHQRPQTALGTMRVDGQVMAARQRPPQTRPGPQPGSERR